MDQVGLKRHLANGERVVWTGEPNSGLFLSNRQGWAIASWVPLVLVALALAPALWHPPVDGWDVAALFALAWLAPATWQLGHWLVRRRGEAYVVTSRRILVLERDGSIMSETSLLRAHEFRRVSAPQYLDTLVLGDDLPLLRAQSMDLSSKSDAPRLSAVPGGDSLLALIRKTSAAWEVEWAKGDENG